MKKIILFVSILSLSLISCSYQKKKDTFLQDSPIIISEFQRGSLSDTRVIEIANISEETVCLSDYYLAIYHGNYKEIEAKISFTNISLDSQQTYVIVYDKAPTELLEKADLISPDLIVDGTWPITLNKGDKIVDTLGIIGYQNDYGKNIDLVRKKEFLIGREFYNPYDWIRYSADDFTHLGTIETTISEEELLMGPKLSQEDFLTPFSVDGYTKGGAVEVQLAYVGDGDTTNFRFPSSIVNQGVNPIQSVRYVKINTPEIQHGHEIDAQPWGEAAKRYNNEILENAKHFVVQTERNSSMFDTYGRLLGYVWYTNNSNPSPEDYVCLNFEMLLVGLAFLYFYEEGTYAQPNKYRGISYTNIFKNAQLYAENKGIKIHGEIDPEFDY